MCFASQDAAHTTKFDGTIYARVTETAGRKIHFVSVAQMCGTETLAQWQAFDTTVHTHYPDMRNLNLVIKMLVNDSMLCVVWAKI